MISSFLCGVLLALGHHLFYQSLDNKSASVQYDVMRREFDGQQLNIAIGTAFAFLVKAAFVLAVSTTYYQIFWRHMQREVISDDLPTLKNTDSAFSGLDNIISLLTIPMWCRYPFLFTMAAVAW